jgi:hypothetical protein
LPYNLIRSLSNSFETQEILALGFPAVGNISYGTKPLVRKGIISWISPIEPDKVPFLIDCNIFPGNSGGPIFLNSTGLDELGRFQIGGAFEFLGIVSKYTSKLNPIFSPSNRLILDQKNDPIYSQESMSLGIIEPAKRILELLEHAQSVINQ